LQARMLDAVLPLHLTNEKLRVRTDEDVAMSM
jgi:hypothetical protein